MKNLVYFYKLKNKNEREEIRNSLLKSNPDLCIKIVKPVEDTKKAMKFTKGIAIYVLFGATMTILEVANVASEIEKIFENEGKKPPKFFWINPENSSQIKSVVGVKNISSIDEIE